METQAVKTLKRVVAELQATYNVRNQIPAIKIATSENVARCMRKIYPIDIETQEAFMYLNRANNERGFSVISIGSISGTVADPKVIFQHALLCNGAGNGNTSDYFSAENLRYIDFSSSVAARHQYCANSSGMLLQSHFSGTRRNGDFIDTYWYMTPSGAYPSW